MKRIIKRIKKKIIKETEVQYEYTGNEYVPQNVVSVRFHPSVVEVDNYAFEDRKQLREVVLNDGLREIGEDSFYGCKSLKSIKIPSTVVEIGDLAFGNCTEMKEIVLNDGLKRIENSAFAGCSLLHCITIPSTVIEIEALAFEGCTNLREVVIVNEEVQIGYKSFWGCSSLARFKFLGLSTRLENVIQAGQRDIKPKIDDIPDVEWRDGELSIPAVHRPVGGVGRLQTIPKVDKEKLNKVKGLIRYYETKEATTLFELAIWKARIDQVDDADDINRDAYRIDVPGPVKETVLQYISNE